MQRKKELDMKSIKVINLVMSIYTSGIINNCTFIDNSAITGGFK